MTTDEKVAFDEAFTLYRKQRADELREIAELLLEKDLISDPSPIYQAASQSQGDTRIAVKGAPDEGREYWGYDIADLSIKLEPQRHLRPSSAVPDLGTGMLSVTVQEYLPREVHQIGSCYGLLRQMCVEFQIDTFQEVGTDLEELRAAWHIDTHLFTETRSHAAHPRFHFQVGGHRLKGVDEKIRGVLMPEAPRVPCAPLDAILAVDFILAHYCGDGWKNLREGEPRYGRVRKSPMQRYWSPYFRTLVEGIDSLDSFPRGGAAFDLIPSICLE
jgi:hypothetical protein